MTNKLSTLLLLTFFGASPLSASINYLFTINTQSLNTQAGNLDFQLNPGGLSAPGVAVQISNFSITGGSYAPGNIVLTGDAAGLLPSSLILDNFGSYNDAFQPVTLGTSISFLATLSGGGIDNPGNPGTFFGFSIYDAAGVTPELTVSGDGTIAGFNAGSVNGVSPFTNPASINGPSAASVTTPEPSSRFLLVVGLGMGLFLIRRRA